MASKKPISANNINVTGDFIAGDQYNYYYSGDFASLSEYYISPDSVFQRVHVDEFIGRDWLTAKVDAFLNDSSRKSGAFLLIGDAGVGKTSFMAHLVKERRYLHLFAEQTPGQAMLQRAMQSLGSQLVTRYQIDPYKDRDTLNALSVFPDFLERILRLAANTLTEGEKIVIVCDALDEAGTFPDHFVFGLPKELPDGVFLILSQRPVNVKLPNFEPVIEKLEAQGEGNLQDIQAYLSTVAKRPEVAGQIRSKEYSEEFFIQTLKEKSQGVWMYLHYIIKEIESGARAPLDLANLPTGLVGYYAEYWDAWRTGKRGKGEEAWDELYAPLLTTLAAAQEAIPVDWLIQWADVTVKPREVTRLLTEHWQAFITEKEKDGQKTYTPYHLSFRDFITGRVNTTKLPPAQANLVKDIAAQTVEAHKRIVTAFEKECNGEWEKLVEQDYPRLHLTAHLNGAREYEKLRILLTEGNEKIKWAEARGQKEETYAGYLNDLTYVWDYAERDLNFVLSIRCKLIESSIFSQAMQIPPDFLLELAKSGLWGFARCLNAIKQYSQNDKKINAINIFAPFIPLSLYEEFLSIIFTMNEEKDIRKTIEIILPFIPKDFLPKIIQEVKKIRNEYEKIRILMDISEYTNDIKYDVLLSHIRKITDNYERSLSMLIYTTKQEGFPKRELILECLSNAQKIEDTYSRASILTTIIAFLPIERRSDAGIDGLKTIQRISDENLRGFMLPKLSQHFQDEIFETVILEAKKLRRDTPRVKALTFIACQCANVDQRTHMINEVFSSICNSVCKFDEFSEIIPTLAPLLNTEQVLHFIVLTRKNKNPHSQSVVLNALISQMRSESDHRLIMQTLQEIRQINNNAVRSKALTKLLGNVSQKMFTQVFSEALSSALSELNARDRFYALQALLKFASEVEKSQIKDKILLSFQSMEKDLFYLRIATEFEFDLSIEERNKILKDLLLTALTIGDQPSVVAHKIFLFKIMPINLRIKYSSQLIVDINNINQYGRMPAVIEVTPYLSDEMKNKALFIAKNIEDDSNRVITIANISHCFDNEVKLRMISEILKLALSINDRVPRIEALSAVALLLPEDLKLEILKEIINSVCDLDEEFFLSNFTNLLSHLPVEEYVNIMNSAGKFKREEVLAGVLIDIFPSLPDDIKLQTISLVKEFKNEKNFSQTFNDLIYSEWNSVSQQVLQEFLTYVQSRRADYEEYSNLLCRLIPYMYDKEKTKYALEVLSITPNIFSEYVQSNRLLNILPFLPDKKHELVEKILSLSYKTLSYSKYSRAEIISRVAEYLEPDIKIEFLVAVLFEKGNKISLDTLPSILEQLHKIEFHGFNLEYFSKLIRQNDPVARSGNLKFIEILTPALVHFRGPDIVPELYRTITDVTRWWP